MAKTLIGNVKGPPGDKGKTPYIGENGNWWIDGKDTGVEATAGAAAAQSAAAAAQTAKTAAETAKSGAESAKTAAASSASAAKASETNAASAASSANSSKNAAASSATTAESAAVRAQECLTEVQTKLENGEFDGEDATIESVTAEVDGSYLAHPTVTVTAGGTPSKRTFHFAFKGLRGLSGGGSGGGGTAVQADWSVNDPNDPSHVKERTHWKEVFDGPEGEIIPETSLVFNGNFNFGQLSGMSAGVQIGGYYIVTHNGTDYECVGRDSGDGAYIGNGSLLSYGNLANTGEPFCILAFGGTVYYLYKADKTAETVTVKVVGKKETIWHKLDDGYLPEGVPYVETNVVEILPETTAAVDLDANVAMLPDIVDVTSGNTYTVTWNGTKHTCIAQFYGADGMTGVCLGDLGAMIGGESTGEPFVMVCFDAETAASMGAGIVIMPLDGSASVALSISGEVKVFHKMLPDLLPEGTPYAEPFDDVIMAAWPSSIQSDGMFSDPAGLLVAGNIYKVNWGGTIYECAVQEIPDSGMGLGNLSTLGGKISAEPFGILLLTPALGEELGATGIILFDNPPANYEFSIIGGWKVQQIDKRCLPNDEQSNQSLLVKLYGGAAYDYSASLTYPELKAAITGDGARIVHLVETDSDGNMMNGGQAYSLDQMNGGTFYFHGINVSPGNDIDPGTRSVSLDIIEWSSDDVIKKTQSIKLTT